MLEKNSLEKCLGRDQIVRKESSQEDVATVQE